jgi:hypothetical protein
MAKKGRQHQRDRQGFDRNAVPRQQEPQPPTSMIPTAGLDDADQLGFVAHVGKLPGECREQEKGQDEQPRGNRRKAGFLLFGL